MNGYLKGTKGPLTKYLRSKNNNKNPTNIIMSASIPRIKVVNDDTDRTTVTVKNPIKLDNIDIVSDSGSSVQSIKQKAVPPKSPLKKKQTKKINQLNQGYTPEELQYFMNSQKQRPQVEKYEEGEDNEESASEESEENYGNEYQDDYSEYDDDISEDAHKVNNIEQEKRKRELLMKLVALENKGVELSKKFTTKSKYADIEFEYEMQKKNLETEAGIKFQQKALMAFVTGVEFLNNRFDPVGAKLDGWSESVMDSMNDYDNCFRRLYEKYSERSQMAPEFELLLTLTASGFMFHLTNSFFKNNMPAMNDVFKSNPDIMKNIATAMGNMQQNTSSNNNPKEMSGPSVNLSSLINNNSKLGPEPPQNTFNKNKSEMDRFSVASSEDSVPVSTVSKNGKKTITIS
jgi:hypothetical protein